MTKKCASRDKIVIFESILYVNKARAPFSVITSIHKPTYYRSQNGMMQCVRMSFSNRSVKQRQDILTNKLAANTHVIARKTQIAQCAAVNNWGDTWNIIRWWAIMF